MSENMHQLTTPTNLCPNCGKQGQEVAATTLRHLLLPHLVADEMMAEGYRFCATADCEVV